MNNFSAGKGRRREIQLRLNSISSLTLTKEKWKWKVSIYWEIEWKWNGWRKGWKTVLLWDIRDTINETRFERERSFLGGNCHLLPFNHDCECKPKYPSVALRYRNERTQLSSLALAKTCIKSNKPKARGSPLLPFKNPTTKDCHWKNRCAAPGTIACIVERA